MIKYALFDVDGVMTDGSIMYLDHEVRGRVFHFRDGIGIKQLQAAGIQTWMISGENDPHLYERAENLGMETALGATDKTLVMRDLGGIPPEGIAFIGDDVTDIPLMRLVGMPACPFDAHKTAIMYIINRQGFVCHANGGEGAVREFCDYILEENKRELDGIGMLHLAGD